MSNNEIRQRKKLLVLTSTFPRWKNDEEPPFVLELCRRLARNFDILVVAPHAEGSSLEEYIDGIQVRRYRYFFEKWEVLAYRGGILANLKQNRFLYLLVPFFLAAQTLAISRQLQHEKFDAIQAHWIIPQGLACILSRIISNKRIPAMILTSHGSDLFGLNESLFIYLKRQILQCADAVTVVSRALAERALDLGADTRKLSPIPMGVDAQTRFFPSTTDLRSASELLFVGRLVPSKSVNALLEAMPTILESFPHSRLIIAGEGPDRKNLESLAERIGISSRVSFLGAINNSDLPDLYRRAAVFLSASLSEGFGLTLCEAAACECPIIAPDLPACGEIIIDGQTGLLVAPGSSRAIAKKAKELLADPALRQRLGRAARRHVLEKFDWQIIAPQYVKVIETAIAA